MTATPEQQRHNEALAAAGVPIEKLGNDAKQSLQNKYSESITASKSLAAATNNTSNTTSGLYVGNLVPSRIWGFAPLPPKEASPERMAKINSTTNQVHSMMDIAWGCTAYGLSTMMVFHGQSTVFSFVSMWGAGTYLFALSQLRHVRGPEPEIWQGELQCVALWFLASFRQFREYRTLKWAGYSSWSGLALSAYYSVRALAATMEGGDNYKREF